MRILLGETRGLNKMESSVLVLTAPVDGDTPRMDLKAGQTIR